MQNISQDYQLLISSPSWDSILLCVARFSAHFASIGGDINLLTFHISGSRGAISVFVATEDDTALFQMRSICSDGEGYLL